MYDKALAWFTCTPIPLVRPFKLAVPLYIYMHCGPLLRPKGMEWVNSPLVVMSLYACDSVYYSHTVMLLNLLSGLLPGATATVTAWSVSSLFRD